jgi:putative two-component system response regulator
MRVLIVDNDAESVALIEKMVARIARCTTMHYTDAAEAQRQLHDIDFDLALISYQPGASGLLLTMSIRDIKKHAQVPIVIMTGAVDRPEIRVDAFEIGATDFLTKPLEPSELRARLRNLMQLREAQLALAKRADTLKSEVMRATDKLKAREKEIVLRLCRAVEQHDNETSDHIGRMARYCYLIAEELGFERETCEFMHLAAHMHDIGKIGVPSEILRKPTRLTADERLKIEKHTLLGEQILDGSASPLIQLAAIIAASHHERWDGGGYPRGLKGEDIPIAGRIAAVADVFDALSSKRRYKAEWPLEESRQYLLENRGKHFDPACVEALLRRWDEVTAICSGESEIADAA